MHNEDNVLPDLKASDPRPDGNWISPNGQWQIIVSAKLNVDQVGRNPCDCSFCKRLRAKYPEARPEVRPLRLADVIFPETKSLLTDEELAAWIKQHVYINSPGIYDDDGNRIDDDGVVH
jgi:hypothetical protein